MRKEDYLRVSEYTIKDSIHLGKEFFVCDFRHVFGQTRAVRDIKPTRVVLVSNEKYNEECKKSSPPIIVRKIFEYCNVFISSDKKGNLNFKKNISIYDNTGSNKVDSYALFVFDTEKEAKNKYNELINEHVNMMEEEKEKEVRTLENRLNDQIEFFKNKIL